MSCVVTGILKSLTGTPVPGALVAVSLDTPGRGVSFVSGSALSREEVRTETDANGAFSLTLQQGARVVLRIPDLGMHAQLLIPSPLSVTPQEFYVSKSLKA
jgi:hypothetical protein